MTSVTNYYKEFSQYLLGVKLTDDCLRCKMFDDTKEDINCELLHLGCPGVVLKDEFRRHMIGEVKRNETT